MVPVDRYGAYWSWLLSRAVNTLAGVQKCTVIRYERLVTAPTEELQRLVRFLDLPAAGGQWLEWGSGLIKPTESRWRELPVPERNRLERSCRAGMRLLDRLPE